MARALTTAEFIQQAKVVHGEKYDYSKVEYAGTRLPVVIICPKHGQFKTKASNHLKSSCRECWKESRKASSGPNALTTEEFILKAKAVHGERYDYSETEYLTKRTRIAFTCEIHGRIEQFPLNHLSSSGCNKCSRTSLLKKPRKKELFRRVRDIESFIAKANKIHEGYYSYDKSVYTRSDNQIVITCPKHGEFSQKASNHLSGFTCKQCSLDKISLSFSFHTAQFIDLCQSVHGDEYDYSITKYINTNSNVTVRCKKHGPFEVTPSRHLKGVRCKKCYWDGQTQSTEGFVESAKRIHGDMYDYSETDYINNDTKVAIICKEHGAFYQLPRSHISSRAGCAACNEVDFWDINNLTELQKLAPNGLYVMYMRSEDHSEEFIKVGISNDSKRRIKEIEWQSGYIVTLLSYIECNTKTALEHEKSLHDELYDYNYKPKSRFAGRSECFDMKALPILESKSFLTLPDCLSSY